MGDDVVIEDVVVVIGDYHGERYIVSEEKREREREKVLSRQLQSSKHKHTKEVMLNGLSNYKKRSNCVQTHMRMSWGNEAPYQEHTCSVRCQII